MSKRYWLLKTEPDVFSFDDLLKAPQQITAWEGVRNYQARNFMRDDMKKGDQVFIYHSSCEEPGIVGVGEVVREAYPDPAALNPKSPYFDEKSKELGESRWVMVDVKAVKALKEPFTLARLRTTAALKTMLVLKKGQRLSIQPVTEKEWQTVLSLSI